MNEWLLNQYSVKALHISDTKYKVQKYRVFRMNSAGIAQGLHVLPDKDSRQVLPRLEMKGKNM